MLGRAPSRCDGPQARRGDDQLYKRVLTLTPDQLAEQRRRAREIRESVRRTRESLGIHRKSDWV